MNPTVIIDGSDYSNWLMTSGAQNIGVQVEDTSGAATLSSAKLRLSNIEDACQPFLSQSNKSTVSIRVGTINVFEGLVGVDGLRYNVDDRIVELDMIAQDAVAIEKMRASTLRGVSLIAWRYMRCYTEGSTRVRRAFLPVWDIIQQCAFGAGLAGAVLDGVSDRLHIGGADTTPFATNPLKWVTGMTCYEIITNVTKLLNAAWWVANNRLYISTRRNLFQNRKLSTPYVIQPLSGTLTLTRQAPVFNIISFAYSAKNEYPADRVNFIREVLRGNSNSSESLERSVNLMIPETISTTNLAVLIRTTDRETAEYVVDIAPGANENDSDAVTAIPAGRILRDYYTIELLSRARLTCDASLMDDLTGVQRLIEPYAHVSIVDSAITWFVTKCTLDAHKEQAALEARGYSL